MEKNKEPLVSIVSSSYNFERFIPYFLESILSQTYTNWELIITDDCSSDNSFEILKNYEKDDNRIKIFRNDKNKHVCYTLNNSLKKATGKYICIISCDDALLSEKIAHDVDFMEQNDDVGVLYGQLLLINEDNEPQGNYGHTPLKDFQSTALLREMFLAGNQCIAPGMFVRKSIVEMIGIFNPLLRMTQDYEYHIRLLFKTNPVFNFIPLTEYRRMSDNSNLSSYNVQTTINSELNETYFILKNYLENIKDYSLLKKIFPEVAEFGPQDDLLIPYYIGRIAMNAEKSHLKAFGMQTIYDFMINEDNVKYLEEKVGYTPKDFMYELANSRIFYNKINSEQKIKLFKKIKTKLFKIKVFIRNYKF